MSQIDHIKKLIVNHNRRLQSLKEQQALTGLDTSPQTLIEIENIEAEITKLQRELRTFEERLVYDATSLDDKTFNQSNRIQINEAEIKHLQAILEKWKFMSELSFQLYSTLNYRNLLRTVVDLAYFLAVKTRSYDDESIVCLIMLFEDSSGDLTIAAGRNMASADKGRKIDSESGLIGTVIRMGEATITNNLQRQSLSKLESLKEYQSAICVPIKAGFSKYGVILICSTEAHYFNDEHKELFKYFCDHALIALQNAQLFEDSQRESQKTTGEEGGTVKKQGTV